MEKHNPIFSLKNFRSFGEDGADFELAPITVLTGCNSAGKSSLVKSLLLLSKETGYTTYHGEIGRRTPAHTLPISTQDLALGRFDKILNVNASNEVIELSYHVWSNYLQETVEVTRKYKSHSGDVLNNGELTLYTIKKIDGTTIYRYLGSSDKTMMGEPFFDAIQSNYNVFQAALEYSINPVKYLEEGNERLLSESETEMLKEFKEQKKQMAGHSLEDFGHSISEWFESIANREEKYKASLYELKRLEEKAALKEFAKDRISQVVKDKNDNEEEQNKELYMSLICNEVVYPDFLQDIVYADSSSASIKRLYSIEENNKLCNALRKMHHRKTSDYAANREGISFTNYAGSFLNKWIKEKFKLGEKIEVEGTEQGLGMIVFLKKENGERRLLADEGYGITQLVSLLLYIDNMIPSEPNNDYDGIGEYMPGYKPRYICVEEPENHLHPKFQSMLAEMFVEAYQKYNIHFIIETHSEYLIRKLQVMVADKNNTLTSNDVSLNYVEKDEHGVSHNKQIKIKEDGRLDSSFGEGFYDEADNLTMELIRYKAQLK